MTTTHWLGTTTNNANFVSSYPQFSYILYISLMIQITFMAVTAKKEIKVNMAYKVNISNADLSTELIEWL